MSNDSEDVRTAFRQDYMMITENQDTCLDNEILNWNSEFTQFSM